MTSDTTAEKTLCFAKMSGAGNDFIVVDAGNLAAHSTVESARLWCRRRLSIGADGLLAVSRGSGDLVRVRYWNADGSEAEFCGNGARCAARFASLRWQIGPELTLEFSGVRHAARIEKASVSIESAAPIVREERMDLLLDGKTLSGHRVRAGVEHLIFAVGDVAAIDLARLAQTAFRQEPDLLGRVNISALSSRQDRQIDLRTFERGSGETLACGSAALAAAACMAPAEAEITVWPPSGCPLTIRTSQAGGSSVLSGEARLVYEGKLIL